VTSSDWPAPVAAGPVVATVALPGSKSLTNRYLVLAALAAEPSRLRAPLRSRDTLLMAAALSSLGTGIADAPASGSFGDDWLVTPAPLRGPATIDCGLAGTVMRFLPPAAALASWLVSTAMAILSSGRTTFWATKPPTSPPCDTTRWPSRVDNDTPRPYRAVWPVVSRWSVSIAV